MESLVTSEDDGTTRRFVGVTVCEGPGTHRLILTHPYHEAGRIVEIPNSKISSVQELEAQPLGELPPRA